MTSHGRSLDDLPLTAYSTGVVPDDAEEDVAAAPAYVSVPASPLASADALMPAPHGSDPIDPLTAGSAGALRLRLPAVPPWLAHPRGNLRDPRLILLGVIGLGLVLLLVSLLLGGGGPGGSGLADASPSAPAAAFASSEPTGIASVEVTGAVIATYELLGGTATNAATASIESSWGDTLGNTLVLGGPVSAGTRTTGVDFVLSWTVMVKNAPVTFTSKSGECTVGMAVKPKTVSGSFVCKQVKSADGKLVVAARGTYRT